MAEELPKQPVAEAPEPAEAPPVEPAEALAEAVPVADQSPAGPSAEAPLVGDVAAVSDGQITEAELEQLRASEVAFSWHASEYVHHHKSAGWYAAMFGGLAALVLAVVLLKSWLSTAMFVVMGVAIWVYARKPPRTLLYELTPVGITIEGKVYLFKELRSFGVISDEDWHVIDLEPKKRFALRLSVLFEDDDFDEIVGHLELHLPRIDRAPDLAERITRYLRF